VQLYVDMRERFESRAELAASAAHTFGHRADQPVVAGEQGDDPVGFAELVLAQHHRSIPVQPHRYQFVTTLRRHPAHAPIMSVPMSNSPDHRFPTLTDQLYQLASGEVTSDELVRRSLHAIGLSQSTLNAFRVVLTETALADAAQADRRRAAGDQSPLLGVPIAVKDDVDVAGQPTAFGTSGYVQPATQDAEVVRRLKAAGAVIVGKTNACELGQWPFTSGPGFGHTRNPWSRRHTPGGSSGGSAAAVAAGLVTRRDRLRRRRQRSYPGGLDPPRRHQTPAWPHLDMAAARGIQWDHGQRRAGPHGRRRCARARRGVRQRRRRPAQAATGDGVRPCRHRARPPAHRAVNRVPVHRF